MKMVKSLLLGSAAGLVAVAGAQAADLPVKAKPVEYVKICSIYGAGFFYIPGTDTCIKIGGWVRAEDDHRQTGNSHAQFTRAAARGNNRITPIRSASAPVRCCRSTCAPRPNTAPCAPTTASASQHHDRWSRVAGVSLRTPKRAFIQIAGFTFGKTQSYFDFVGGAALRLHAYGGGPRSSAPAARSCSPTRQRSATA